MEQSLNHQVMQMDDASIALKLSKIDEETSNTLAAVRDESETIAALESIILALESVVSDTSLATEMSDKLTDTEKVAVGKYIEGDIGLESYGSVLSAITSKAKEAYQLLIKLIRKCVSAFVEIFTKNVDVIEHCADIMLKLANRLDDGSHVIERTVDIKDLNGFVFAGIGDTDLNAAFLEDCARLKSLVKDTVRETARDAMRLAFDLHKSGVSNNAIEEKELAVKVLRNNAVMNLRKVFSRSNVRGLSTAQDSYFTDMFVGGSVIEMASSSTNPNFVHRHGFTKSGAMNIRLPSPAQVMQMASAMRNDIAPNVRDYANIVKNVGKNIDEMVTNLERTDKTVGACVKASRELVNLYTELMLSLSNSLLISYRTSCMATVTAVKAGIKKVN